MGYLSVVSLSMTNLCCYNTPGNVFCVTDRMFDRASIFGEHMTRVIHAMDEKDECASARWASDRLKCQP